MRHNENAQYLFDNPDRIHDHRQYRLLILKTVQVRCLMGFAQILLFVAF